MKGELESYLEEVKKNLHLRVETEDLIIQELRSHFHEVVREGVAHGLSEEVALKRALEEFGRPKAVGRLMFEAHSKVTWKAAALASLPHLIVAALFAFGGWDQWLWLVVLFTPIVGVTLFGWWQGKPAWLYPWVGYSLIPLVITGYLTVPILRGLANFIFAGGPAPTLWGLAACLIFFPLAAWIVVSTTIRVANRNWILASLMLFPIPVVAAWLMLLESVDGLLNGPSKALHGADGTMSLVYFALAMTTVVFIRLRDTALKVSALTVVAFLLFTGILWTSDTNINTLTMVITGVLILALFLTPAAVESVSEKREGVGNRSRYR